MALGSWRVPVSVLLLAALAAGCGDRTGPSSEPTGVATAAPSTAPAGGILDPAVPHACFGLGERDCALALEAAFAAVDPTAAPVTHVQVGPFGCRTGEGCERSLAARPAGSVTFELVDAAPVEIAVELGADGAFTTEPVETFTVELEPSSPLGELSGPRPYGLGHCGLWSGIDVDGSWWDPVGLVDSDHPDSINAAEGTIAPTGPNQATFASTGGLVVALVRHQGAKHLRLCQ